MSLMSDKQLRVLFPARDIEVAGERMTLRPFPFGKLPKVIGYLGDMMHLITNIPEELIAVMEGEDAENDWKVNPELIGYFTTVIEIGGENILNMMALAVGKPREWVDELDPDEGLLLLMDVFEVNYDFFKQRFAPAFKKITGRARSISEMLKSPTAGEKS